MQAVLSDMWLEVDRAAAGATLWADVRRLVLMDSLVWQKTALIWKKHLADGACFLWAKKTNQISKYILARLQKHLRGRLCIKVTVILSPIYSWQFCVVYSFGLFLICVPKNLINDISRTKVTWSKSKSLGIIHTAYTIWHRKLVSIGLLTCELS